MGKIVGAYILPHPPIMIEEVGGKDSQIVSDTIKSLEKVSSKIAKQKPDTLIIITPHGPMFSDAMTFFMEDELIGDFSRFGAPMLSYKFQNDMELAGKIMEEADKEKVYCIAFTKEMARSYNTSNKLDHGALVPLHFIGKDNKDVKLVHITYSGLPIEDHYKLGISIKNAVRAMDRDVVIIASGDLSHRLTFDAPAGFDKRGKEYDNLFLELVEKGDVKTFLSMDKGFISVAGECAYKSAVVMFGSLDKCHISGHILSYEGPFGVGYGVAELNFEDCPDPYVKLAIETLENKVKYNKTIKASADLPDELLSKRAGVFVTLYKNGELRGCIGTINPTRQSIADEIIQNAISAGLKDPRFMPIKAEELDDLVYSVDVLGEAEEIDSLDKLDPKRYGVIVRKARRTGLLLPNLDGIDTAEEQVAIALRKAGISENEDYELERFEVIRHYQ